MRRTFKKKVELAAGRLTINVLYWLSGRLNPARIKRWGSVLGGFMFYASRRYRVVARRNLKHAFPEWTEAKVTEVSKETFRNFARGVLEFFYLLDLPANQTDQWISVEGMEHLDAALAKGRGAVIVTAHLGNWELFARKVALSGYKINVIARDSDDPGMTGIVKKIRQNAGYKVLDRDNSALPAMRCLRRNEILGVLPDQNTKKGIFVDFFGRPVATAIGPAVMAIRGGASILCGFARRTPEGTFRAVIYPPLEIPDTGDEDSDVVHLTAILTNVIEKEILKDPAQWLWIHDRWRRTQEAPNNVGSSGAAS